MVGVLNLRFVGEVFFCKWLLFARKLFFDNQDSFLEYNPRSKVTWLAEPIGNIVRVLARFERFEP